MECFALIGMMNNKKRYIHSHPVLKNLPLAWSEKFVLKQAKPRITGTILNKRTNSELGYIIDVPGFFLGWDRLTKEKRLKYIHRLLKIMKKNGINIMVVPLMNEFFTKQEYDYCLHEGFILLDSFNIRLASQIEVVERLISILRKKLHIMEVIIWRADTDIGEIWAEFLAPYFNYMVLGGKERKKIEELSEKIINKTGLACRIVEKIENIPKEHSILIWTEKFDQLDNYISNRLIIFSNYISYNYLNRKKFDSKNILFESGLIRLPDDIFCNVELYPLEELGVLDGFLYTINELYRILLHDNKINLKKFSDLRKLFELYSLHCEGFISFNEIVSYNKFRKIYFRKN